MVTPAIMLGLLAAPVLLGYAWRQLTNAETPDSSVLGCVGLSLVFCFTGVGHFLVTQPMAAMLPDWVPGRVPLVYVTGVIELAAAGAVLISRTRFLTGWFLIGLLLLFLPVNFYAAFHRVEMGGHAWDPIYLLIRVPLQLILIGWTWVFAVRPAAALPIEFRCEETVTQTPEQMAAQILHLENWQEFDGYGPLPGIEKAEFETKTPEVVGTRIRVTNRDGSTHVEELTEWDPDVRLKLHLTEFSPPLSRLTSGFDEVWEFERRGSETKVVRSFALHARSAFGRLFLWGISFLFKRAIIRHLRQMQRQAMTTTQGEDNG